MVIYLNRDIPFDLAGAVITRRRGSGLRFKVWLPLCLCTVCFCARGCTPTARYGRMYETTHTRANITYLLYAHTHGRLQCTARWGDREHRNGNNNTTKPPLNFSNADSKHRIFLNELLTGLLWTHRRTTKWGPALLARVPKAGNMAQHKLVWTPGFGIRRVQWTWICVVSFVLTFLNSGTLGQGMYSCVHSGTA